MTQKKLIPRDKQKLIYVKWQDAHSQGGWLSHDDAEREVNSNKWIAEEVGWVIYEDASEVHIVGRRGTWEMPGSSEYGMYQRIPKAWILKRELAKH